MSQPPDPFRGRDPRQPFGTPQAPQQDPTRPILLGDGPGRPPLDASHFAVAPRRPRWWIALVALLALGLLGWAAVRLSSEPAPLPEAPASQEPVSTAPWTPTSIPSSPTTVPFENPAENATGSFEILHHAWTAQGLQLTVRVHLDTGAQRLNFFALDNTLATDYQPTPVGPDSLVGQAISAGQTLTGTVLFTKPTGATTVFLTGTAGKQVAALVVS